MKNVRSTLTLETGHEALRLNSNDKQNVVHCTTIAGKSPVRNQRAMGQIRPIFRPVQYLGSKLRVVDAITSIARDIVPSGSSVTDLFAGSSIVAQGLAHAGFRVTAIDTQTYSAVFCRAMLGVQRAPNETIDAAPVLAAAALARRSIGNGWHAWQEREDFTIAARDGAELRTLDEELPLAWRLGRFVADQDAPLTSFYAGSYFGVRQALDLDMIRAAIATSPDLAPGSWRHAAALTDRKSVV